MDGNLNLLTQMRYVANCDGQKDLGSGLPPVGPIAYKAFIGSDIC